MTVDLQRAIIDYDSQALLGGSEGATLNAFRKIPWPEGLDPQTSADCAGQPEGPLPKADVLVVTWTTDEGHALSKVLSPGKDSHSDYLVYAHNYDDIAKTMSHESPAVQAKRLGTWWTTTIGNKKVLLFKSDSHMSQDTQKKLPADNVLPNAVVWKQIIDEVHPKLVISTGTAGGVGPACEVGDVVVASTVRFVSRQWLKDAPFGNDAYHCSKLDWKHFQTAHEMIRANAHQLPPRKHPPMIEKGIIATTDFFGFDTADDYYKLRGAGQACEMGDAVLGMVMEQYRVPPRWCAVRNVSDPQIKSRSSIGEQGKQASNIYKKYGLWSSVCSAIVCWALIATEE